MNTPHINLLDDIGFGKTVLMPGDPLRAKMIAEVFLENGWEITEGAKEPVLPGDISFGKIEKDGYEYDVIFSSPVEYAIYPENSCIVSIEQSMHDGKKAPFSFSGEITMGKKMSVYEVMECFDGMDVDADTEYADMGLEMIYVKPTEDSESKVSYYIVITDGFISDMEIKNNVSFEK